MSRLYGPPTARARRRGRPAQCEVEEKSKQVGNQRGNERPENGRHGAASSVCVDVAETEEPDGGQSACEQAHTHAKKTIECGRCGGAVNWSLHNAEDDADEHATANGGTSGDADRFWHSTQKLMSFHRTLPFVFVDRARSRSNTGKNREKHQEGAIQKVNKPAWA